MNLHPDAASAVAAVQANQRVFVQGAAATPTRLIEALVREAPRLRDVELVHLHTIGPVTYAQPEHAASFRVAAFFVGPNLRPWLDPGRVDYIPIFLSEVPALFRSGQMPLDVALIHVSPPDRHGYCTLGTSIDVAKAAVETARIVIAQINPRMPRVHGDGFVHINQIHHAIHVDEALPEERAAPAGPTELAIARHVAGLIEDGSTLQIGIGAIPNAVLGALKDHRHLGIHTEMWTDGTLDLLRSGAVDNSRKRVHPGKTVSTFILGSREVYDFANDNPAVVGLESDYVNDSANIARNPKVAAINSAVEVDLTGQVCADSIGSRIISGAGGQMDFMRGAALSAGGKPIIALPSRTKSGASRIVRMLQPGAGVVTTRAHVHYVVTEYGVADLRGKTLSQRARALIAIAHPEDREALA